MDFVVTEIDPDRAVVACTGRLNTVAAGAFRETVTAAIDAGRTTVVVDLSGVAFMDSSGLGALVGCLKSARRVGGDLRIAAVPAQVATVLRLSNIDRILVPHATVDEALSAGVA